MIKIWEVDFTSFSGASDTALDNVGNQDLNSHQNINKISGLAGRTNRPGLRFLKSGPVEQYDIGNTGSVSDNAWWNSAYSPTGRRSFVLWIRTNGTWGDDTAPVWGGSVNSTTIYSDGIGSGSSGNASQLVYRYKGNIYQIGSFIFAQNAWHNIVVTIDRNISQQKVYLQGVLQTTINGAGNIPDAIDGIGSEFQVIGDSSVAEGDYDLGYLATYDHILTQSEITDIFDKFIADSPAGESPVVTLSGTINGLDNLPVSGANVYLIRDDGLTITQSGVTDGSGYYEVDVDLPGSYTLVSTGLPVSVSGAIAQPFSVTLSGVVTYS